VEQCCLLDHIPISLDLPEPSMVVNLFLSKNEFQHARDYVANTKQLPKYLDIITVAEVNYEINLCVLNILLCFTYK
jgi:hypothetical protein